MVNSGQTPQASVAQIKYAGELLEQKDVPDEFREKVAKALGDGLTKKQARDFIPLLKALPWLPRDAGKTAATDRQEEYVEGLLEDRVVPLALHEEVQKTLHEGLTKEDAQRFIPLLKALPRVRRGYDVHGSWDNEVADFDYDDYEPNPRDY